MISYKPPTFAATVIALWLASRITQLDSLNFMVVPFSAALETLKILHEKSGTYSTSLSLHLRVSRPYLTFRDTTPRAVALNVRPSPSLTSV